MQGTTGRLDKHVLLWPLQDENKTRYYRLWWLHVSKMLPIVYTPFNRTSVPAFAAAREAFFPVLIAIRCREYLPMPPIKWASLW
ncbi:MAG: hypothetical protein L7W43_20125 [Rubripirellula sp.]|nr:hypothetical protein [Rhodopirellula sp.]MCH1441984.1 hypothetical protein [Rubripirellula sp.]